MPDIPILGNGHRPPGEIYIPGREYVLAVMLDTGDQLTVGIGFNFPPEQIPDPFIPERVCANAVTAHVAQQSATRSEEGTWFLWAHVSAFTYIGPADPAAAPKLRRPGAVPDLPRFDADGQVAG